MRTRTRFLTAAAIAVGLTATPVAAYATPPADHGHASDHVATSICHSGNGTNFTYIAPDASGLNGHDHHDADQFGLTEAACLALNPVTPPPPPAPVYVYEVGYYVYQKLNPAIPAAWENSGEQTLITTALGTDWLSTPALPEWVCGEGWGYQQDKVKYEAGSGFGFPEHITYPDDSGMGWPPIYDAQHGELSVPACYVPPVVPDKPTPRPYSDQGSDFTCEAITDWTKEGFFDLLLVDNIWVENAEPTVVTATSGVRTPSIQERLARGCVVEEPPVDEPPVEEPPVVPPTGDLPTPPVPGELAYTAASSTAGLFVLAGALALALGGLFAAFGVVARRKA